MPREQGSGASETGEGRDGGRADDWQRIETEKPERDAVRRAWDQTHDPSAEFEASARPLPPEYGSHRPKNLELSPEQVAEIEEFTGRPIDQVLATRDKDPRAGHNRDEQGNILDTDGNPREFIDPRVAVSNEHDKPSGNTEQTEQAGLSEHPDRSEPTDHIEPHGSEAAQLTAQKDEAGSNERKDPDRSTDLQAPSDKADSGEAGEVGKADKRGNADSTEAENDVPQGPDGSGRGEPEGEGSAGQDFEEKEPGRDESPADAPGAYLDSDKTPSEPSPLGTTADQAADVGRPTAQHTELELPDDLGELVGHLATDLRNGNLTRDQAAEQLEEFRDRYEPTASESTGIEATTEIVREADGYRYEIGEPAEVPEELDQADLSKLTELRRIAWRRGDDVHEALDKGVDHAFELVESITPTASEQRQPSEIPQYGQARHGVDAGDAATAAMVVAVLAVEAARMGAHRLSTRGREAQA